MGCLAATPDRRIRYVLITEYRRLDRETHRRMRRNSQASLFSVTKDVSASICPRYITIARAVAHRPYASGASSDDKPGERLQREGERKARKRTNRPAT